ncbi:MAG: hypothetical protein Q4F54_05250 [Coriobacteriia bacterium]|nr:hypothetical protein [Coriobacteriia bacterium]
MLGKHVNVSARNRKLMHKVLCAFMAIVLVGLMVPHGLAAQLNAYAGNEAEQTEVQANPEEGVTTEEPSFAESTESNAISYSVSVTFGKNAAGQDIYIDNTDGQAESTIPQG